jgi:lipid-A-disaccharide synthase
MKYYLIAGEASGDLHGAELMKELRQIDREAEFEFLGGNLMQSVGGILHIHYSKMAFMGIMPVLMNLRAIKRNMETCKKTLLQFNPDLVVLIDYPGFNLRMTEFAKKQGFKTAYYISPKIWAWNTRRVEKVKKFVDKMYSILPFEYTFYQKHGYRIEYVGNPLYEKIKRYQATTTDNDGFAGMNSIDNRPVIALLPGSRLHEVSGLLKPMLETSRYFPGYQFVVAGFEGLDPKVYEPAKKMGIPILYKQTYPLLSLSCAAITASGTATLETALFKVPQMVCYKMAPGWLMERIKPWILKTDFFSLVNLIAEKEVVKEFFQSQVTSNNFKSELENILNHQEYRNQMVNGYHEIESKLCTKGAASIAAASMVEYLKNRNKS